MERNWCCYFDSLRTWIETSLVRNEVNTISDKYIGFHFLFTSRLNLAVQGSCVAKKESNDWLNTFTLYYGP